MAWNEQDRNGQDQDPWGRGKKKQGPPDLDEALRQFQRKLKSLFGGKGSLSKGGGGAKGGAISLGFIGILVLVVWLVSGIFIVSPAEEASILRFGKYYGTVGPGPHWIPRFIDTKYVVNVQKVSNFSYTALMLTKDENIVSVSVAIQYRIQNLRDYLFNLVNPRESLQQATASSLRQVIGHTSLDDILTVGREKVRGNVSVLINKLLDIYQTGLIVTDVVMQPAKAPEEVKAAFDDAIKAQEDEQRFINHAQAYVRGVIPIAQGKAKRILQEANAYRKQVVLKAKGDVARFNFILPQYVRAPKVTINPVW